MRAALLVAEGRVEELTLIYPQARKGGKAVPPASLVNKADDWHYFAGPSRQLRNGPVFAVSPSLGLSRGLTSDEARKLDVLPPERYAAVFGPPPDPVRETIRRQSPLTRNMRVIIGVGEGYMDDLLRAYPEEVVSAGDALDWQYYEEGGRRIAISETLGASRPLEGEEVTLQVYSPSQYMGLFGNIPEPLRAEAVMRNERIREERRGEAPRHDFY